MASRTKNLSIVVRCAYNVQQLKNCLASIPDDVEIIVSTADDSPIKKYKFPDNIKVVTHTFGNWSVAAEVGIQTASYNQQIIMDADSYFGDGAIEYIYEALKKGNLVVKPRIIFQTDKRWPTKIISNIRTHQNEYKPKAYTPGLGIRRKELIKLIGINSKLVYNPDVKYADDGNLSKRIYSKNIPITLVNKAIIYHSPISILKECKTAYILGKGNKQAEERRVTSIELIKREFSSQAKKFYIDAYKRFGCSIVIGLVIWRFIYYFGYFSE